MRKALTLLSLFVDKLEEIIIGVSMLVMTIICFGNVLVRYVFGGSWAFTEEVLIILFVYNSLIGASLALKRNKNMNFSALVERFGTKQKMIADLFIALCTIIMMLVLFIYGWKMCYNQYLYGVKTPSLNLPEYVGGASILFSSVLITIRSVQQFLNAHILKKKVDETN